MILSLRNMDHREGKDNPTTLRVDVWVEGSSSGEPDFFCGELTLNDKEWEQLQDAFNSGELETVLK